MSATNPPSTAPLPPSPPTGHPHLADFLPSRGVPPPDRILDLFLQWCTATGYELYPAQEEALLEVMAGRHVVLSTPTGSGKSLVALGLHFKALCEGAVSFYTSPIKALASEKFFALCDQLGPERVGMLTGDAAINPSAPLICCTAEVLANLALRRGLLLNAPYVVMDEFHYYADRDRGWAWQVPLITLSETRFLLMSATLGDMGVIAGHLRQRTGVEVATVTSSERPVPLDYQYRQTPLHETVEDLVREGRAPIYVVNFTQRACAEVAQGLTSMQLTSREDRERIREAISGSRFDTPYGREFRRFLSFGVGVHHAGLLPRYRLEVERLAQRGLLKVISGTDTLGVGVNIPIRTVLFTALAKFDGRRVARLKVREFKQIAGRAGRKGFDERGSVVCQAPEHEIERVREQAREGKKKRRGSTKPAAANTPSWSEDTFRNLIERPPETLQSRFRVTSGMILDLIQRDAELDDPNTPNFTSLRRLIGDSHEDDGSKDRLLKRAAQLVRSLSRAGIIETVADRDSGYRWVVVRSGLQVDFSLFHTLSLFLVAALSELDRDAEDYPFDLVSVVESVLEDPVIILRKQVDRLKQELLAQLKADGVPYEERMARLDEVTHPQPCADSIWSAFDRFREVHPWVGGEVIHPKSVGRELLHEVMSFGEYVRRYGLQRSEGVLLRYLSQLYKTLEQDVPKGAKNDRAEDLVTELRAMLERVDTSLIEEWESLLHPELRFQGITDTRQAHRLLVVDQLVRDPRAFSSRVRAELHQLIRLLSRRDWEEAAVSVRQAADDPWPAERFEQELAPFFAAHGELLFDHRSRLAEATRTVRTGDRTWQVVQVLHAPDGPTDWYLEGRIDLTRAQDLDGPLIEPVFIGA